MKKKVFVLSVLLLSCLAVLYLVRTELIVRAFNTAMAQTDIRLVQLRGMNLGWGGITIDTMTLNAGINATRQHLDGIRVNYSLIDPTISAILIDSARLSLPEFGDSGEGGNLFIDEILRQLAAAPVDAVVIKNLAIKNPDSNQYVDLGELRWAQYAARRRLTIVTEQASIHISLDEISERGIIAELQSIYEDKDNVSLKLTLQRRETDYHLELQGGIEFEPLYRQLQRNYLRPFLPPLAPLPESVEKIAGKIQFEAAGMIPNDLDQPLKQPFTITLTADSYLDLHFRDPQPGGQNAGESMPPLRASIGLQEAVALTLRPIDAGAIELASPGIAMNLKEARHKLEAGLTLVDLSCHWTITPRCSTAVDGNFSAGEFHFQQSTINGIDLHLQGALELDENAVRMRIAPDSILHSPSLVASDIDITALTIKTVSPLEIDYDIDANETRINLDSLNLAIQKLKTSDMAAALIFDITDLSVFKQTDFNAEAGLKLQTTGLSRLQSGSDTAPQRLSDTWLPDVELNSTIKLREQTVALEGELFSDRKHHLAKLSATHNLSDQTGTATITSLDIAFDKKGNRLSKYFSKWPLKFDIQSGAATLRANLNWDASKPDLVIGGKLTSHLKKVSGYYTDSIFVDLSAGIDARLHDTGHLVSVAPTQVTIDTLDVGVPLQKLSASLSFDFPFGNGEERYQLHRFQAELFGGRARAENFIFEPQNETNLLLLQIENIDIENILTQAAYSNVEGTGKIGGTLPLSIGHKGVRVENGRLAAQKPGGVIRYQDTQAVLANTNPAMKLVSEALSNYHYDTLQADAEYANNGDLTLAIKMHGINPDMNQGQRINLNLNISDNIPTLLKSLQSSRAITDVLEKALEK